MRRVYRALLRLYPSGYIREYGEEMLSVFCRAQEAARRRGLKAQVIFLFREVLGVLTGAQHTQLHYYDWSPFRRFHMRSDFRFPRTTQVLMTISRVHVRIWRIQHIRFAESSVVRHLVSSCLDEDP